MLSEGSQMWNTGAVWVKSYKRLETLNCVGRKQINALGGQGWKADLMAKDTAELGVDRNVIYLDYAACGGGETHKSL